MIIKNIDIDGSSLVQLLDINYLMWAITNIFRSCFKANQIHHYIYIFFTFINVMYYSIIFFFYFNHRYSKILLAYVQKTKYISLTWQSLVVLSYVIEISYHSL